MTYEDDLVLAGRIRSIAADPQPEVPVGVYDYVDRLVAREAGRGVEMTDRRASSRKRFGSRRRIAAYVGVAAAIALAVSGTLLLMTGHTNAPAATPRYPDLWSALEWHDITATGFPSSSAPGGGYSGNLNVVSWGGVSYANVADSGGLWKSTDGMTWHRIAGAPALSHLLATSGLLLGQANADAPCTVPDQSGTLRSQTCSVSSVVWYSGDGSTWHRSSLAIPSGDAITSWAAFGSTALVLASPTDYGTLDPTKATSVAYVTTDGGDWQTSSRPADMAGAISCSVTATRAGLVVSGIVIDPSGPVVTSGSNQAGSFDIHGYQRSWVSSDGVKWSPYQPDFSGPAASFGLSPVFQGSRGDVIPMLGHSTDGIHWSQDEGFPYTALTGQVSYGSNGDEVIICGSGPVFIVTVGDGRWQMLQNGGDVASLPREGEAWAIPGGVLYDAGGRLYFGRALTGVTLPRTIITAPAPTPTPFAPGPTPPPLPSVSLAPSHVWSGVSDIAAIPDGPAGADLVVPWAHGFVALKNGPSGGHVEVWASKDGKSWAAAPDGTFTGSTGQAVAIGDSVMLSTWNDGNGIWFSKDGDNWTRTTIGNPPIGDLPMAGDGRGMVAAMDEPEGQAMYLASPDGQWYATYMPGAEIHTSKSVALSAGGWVLVGKMPGTGAGDWVPAAWRSSDAGKWTESTITDASGQGFVSIVAGRDGFVAVSKQTDRDGNASGSGTLWSSRDGATWTKLTSPLGPNASLAGDDTHIVGCQVDHGQLACWSTLDGQTWTSLTLGANPTTLATLAAAGSNLRAFPAGDGIVFVTPDGAWFAPAVIQK